MCVRERCRSAYASFDTKEKRAALHYQWVNGWLFISIMTKIQVWFECFCYTNWFVWFTFNDIILFFFSNYLWFLLILIVIVFGEAWFSIVDSFCLVWVSTKVRRQPLVSPIRGTFGRQGKKKRALSVYKKSLCRFCSMMKWLLLNGLTGWKWTWRKNDGSIDNRQFVCLIIFCVGKSRF